LSPDLPNLQISAEKVCEFCLLLRDAALAVNLFSGLIPPLTCPTPPISLFDASSSGQSLRAFIFIEFQVHYVHRNLD
jgi:hypothetical protein